MLKKPELRLDLKDWQNKETKKLLQKSKWKEKQKKDNDEEEIY